VVSGSMCHGQKQGDFKSKFKTCALCEFYAKVREEEAERFKPTVLLLRILKKEHASPAIAGWEYRG
jgi:hypothetical protein